MGSAVIESMSENLIDFKLSPMMSFALFGVTGAIAFRAINTLDGMVGFKTKEHINTGWFSANLDNFVNFIPTRLTALLMIVAAAILRMDARMLGELLVETTKKLQAETTVGQWQQWLAHSGFSWKSLDNTFLEMHRNL